LFQQLVRAFAILMIVAIILVTGPSRAALAWTPSLGNPDCPHGAAHISTACLLYPSTGTFYDIYAEFHNNHMYVDPSLIGSPYYAHTKHTLWLYSNSPCQAFVEVGLTWGFQGQNVYTWYWGYRPLNGTALAWQAWPFGQNVYPAQNGSNHSYWVAYDPNSQEFTTAIGDSTGNYRVGWAVGPSSGMGYGGCIGQAGLEFSRVTDPPDTRFQSDTFDLTPLWFRNTFSTGGAPWWQWPNSYSWISFPCGQPQNYVPYCLNGTYNGNAYWADNKLNQ